MISEAGPSGVHAQHRFGRDGVVVAKRATIVLEGESGAGHWIEKNFFPGLKSVGGDPVERIGFACS